MLRAWLALAALTAPAVGGCSKPASSERSAPRETRVAVQVERLEPRAVEYAVSAVGTVEAFERIQISARVAGAVERAEFREGDRVAKDAVLVEIEPRRYQLAAAAATAEVERAKTAREEAEREQKRALALVGEGVGSSMEAAAWASKKDAAEAALAAAKAAQGLAALNLRDARVRAPSAGIIQTRSVQTGEHVPVGKVLATLIRRDPLLLRFEVDGGEARRLATGMNAEFSVRGVPGQFTAKITHIADAADPTTRLVPLVGEVVGGEALRPGSFCEVKVPVGVSEAALVVPQTAVRATARGFVAFVLDGDKARERVVTLGLRTPDGRVEIQRGLAAQELLVVRGGESLREGATVRIDSGEAGSQARPLPSAPPAGSGAP